MERYDNYKANDFLDDNIFIRYMKYKTADDVKMWNDWAEKAPTNLNEFESACISLTAMLSVEAIKPAAISMQRSWEKIELRVSGIDKKVRRIRIIKFASAAAAVLAGVIFGAYWYYNSKITITTNFAQQKELTLPDNSTVLLNANSSITYYRAWGWRQTRQVWINGEGLFKVEHLNKDSAHIKPSERFTVYVGDLSVVDLGTAFNIKERRQNVTVTLISGKISVTGKHGSGVPLILHPGEVVRYTDSTPQLTQVGKLTNQPQAWTDHKMVAAGMTVQEIVNDYEDTYGYQIVLTNPLQSAKKVDGTIPMENEDAALYMLANILDDNVQRQGKIIYLRPK